MNSTKQRLQVCLARLREFHEVHTELVERQDLLNRPWEEDFLHWVSDGEHSYLHGHLAPPADNRRHSVTRNGWCPALARSSRLGR
ncbi:MAG: hypothetical protein JWQ81_2488 [Amycolatopsis sp.]|jgi:hypothetical protein|uniref:hypothetical protein n=1 Tax=Amycolatopsis sp. TaxID=37632 RepID=UPI0026300939|nr:hypothetical protein [Amycolatopsis sp.]MCU1681749.1 hypothetical protein [Amycolatopsis sp.]